jgi:putative transposase
LSGNFESKTKSKPGHKGPSKELIKLVVETKERNPSYGCPRIALLVGNVLGESIDDETVRRILAKHYRLYQDAAKLSKPPPWIRDQPI